MANSLLYQNTEVDSITVIFVLFPALSTQERRWLKTCSKWKHNIKSSFTFAGGGKTDSLVFTKFNVSGGFSIGDMTVLLCLLKTMGVQIIWKMYFCKILWVLEKLHKKYTLDISQVKKRIFKESVSFHEISFMTW